MLSCFRYELAYHDNRVTAYSSDFPSGILQKKYLLHALLFLQYFRFNRIGKEGIDLLPDNQTIYEFLNHNRFNDQFINEYVLPMGAAIWSTHNTILRNSQLNYFYLLE